MKRDAVFNEPVLWTGRPKVVVIPPLNRAASAVCAVTSAICTASAIVVATAVHVRPTQLLLFAAWMATLAIAARAVPRWWRSELEYVLTDQHIVMQRGKLRRTIERRAISYARIHWHPKHPGVGDLELVRAVPTGALRRRLSITLPGVIAPDRVWAILRGVTPSTPAGDGHRLLAQRLDDGERVLWSGHPDAGFRRWVPRGLRSVLSVALGLSFFGFGAGTAAQSVRILRLVVRAGVHPESLTFMSLVATLALTIVLLVAAGGFTLYASVVRPARLALETRYLITDRRVLIQQGDDELHLDRARIVDVIDAPSAGGLRDVFLVLDGPRARAVAASGAFGEPPGLGLQPVLHAVADVDAVRQALLIA
ncbi:hypothetical protein [Chondromyces apiculatus]|uniref:DUF304 domain-containing protein n=1 Tax=Chondromyces apiculatus DSM 436 TaxID=1192034 RepID=A0A017T684_9BACT|nr:hypothetical protein [Chondromyces apiculatus]EYF04734.1 Hypothetical protein CAP_4210 [Chondromyces apiculatus DSM 436]